MTQSSETLLQGFIHSFIHSFTAVPNLFGTRDRFPGRQFFHGWGRGSGMVQAVIRARRSGCKYRRSFARSSDAHLLLFGPVPNRLRTDSCPRPGGWGLLIYYQNVTAGASLVAQWLRVCLLMQGTRVRALVWEDPTCRGAAGPVSHNC